MKRFLIIITIHPLEKTALHLAIEKNNVDMAKLLLQNKNIDVNVRLFEEGKIIKDNHDYEDYNEYCNDKNDDKDDNFDNFDYIDKYDEKYYKEFVYLKQSRVALHIAVQNNSIEIVKLLLQNSKIDVNVTFKSDDVEKDGKTALHFAVENENYGIIKKIRWKVFNWRSGPFKHLFDIF